MEQWAKDYHRFLELELLIPEQEEVCREKQEEMLRLRVERAGAKWEVDQWESPGFFKRIFGKAEEKKEAAWREYRKSCAAYEAACRAHTQAESQLEDLKQEHDALSRSGEAFDRALAEGKGELGRIAPVLLHFADTALTDLNIAMGWMRTDARYTRVYEGNRRMEFLAKADQGCRRLWDILQLLPEDSPEAKSFLQHANDYIRAVSSEYKQLDQANDLAEELRRLRSLFREYM